MRRLLNARPTLALGLAAALLLSAPALAQNVDRVKFETCDGVELHGSFYPSNQGAKASCVLLLHNVGGKDDDNSQQDGWDRLAKALQEKGFAVLSFDFRGYGNSTGISPNFWKVPHNSVVQGNPKKDTISYKEYRRNYYPVLTNDIAAAKAFLDRRDDAGECNSRSLILIGAQEGAVLGTMWLATEMHRYQVVQPFPVKLDTTPEGKSVIACVWLSMSNAQSPWTELGTWLKFIGKERRVPMGFVYGANDTAATSFAQRWVKELKGTSGPTKTYTDRVAIAKSKLEGRNLLRRDLDTVEKIVTYCTKVRSDITAADYAKIEFEKKGYMWSFGARPILAKQQEEKLLRPIPLNYIGIRIN